MLLRAQCHTFSVKTTTKQTAVLVATCVYMLGCGQMAAAHRQTHQFNHHSLSEAFSQPITKQSAQRTKPICRLGNSYFISTFMWTRCTDIWGISQRKIRILFCKSNQHFCACLPALHCQMLCSAKWGSCKKKKKKRAAAWKLICW